MPTPPAGLTRRQFLAALSAGAATSAVTAVALSPLADPLHGGHPHHLHAQDGAPSVATGTPMNQDAARSVRRAPKPNATPQLTRDERDALEHRIKCQCSCTLDVYTCRTTDFACQVSPAMHRDVQSLVDGGYTADEILAAFQDTYGQQVLMAPRREGFNLAGYWMPFAALGTGAVVVGALIRKWGRRAAEVNAAALAARPAVVAGGNGRAAWGPDDATPDELARLEAAVRAEDDGR